MKILVTGSQGFIGKNLVAQLKNKGYQDLLLFDVDTNEGLLEDYAAQCAFVFHLAGVNRPNDAAEFDKGNHQFTCKLLEKLQAQGNHCPIVACSSIQASGDTPYGKSKRNMEQALFSHAETTGAPVFIYRLPNVFGKWCRPNYNSAVATFCYNIARQLDIHLDDPEKMMQLVYIDDVVNAFIRNMHQPPTTDAQRFCTVPVVYMVKLGIVADKLRAFYDNRFSLAMPSLEYDFDRKLYATYVSYLPEKQFAYNLEPIEDNRGYFCECLKNSAMGQISLSVTKPGVVRGNHWHHTKVEKFLVIQGEAAIRFRQTGTDQGQVIEYLVSGEKLEMIDIPVGYTHAIENIGKNDVITLIWCSECFDPQNPDTYFEPVYTQ